MRTTIKPVDSQGNIELVLDNGHVVGKGQARPSSKPGFITCIIVNLDEVPLLGSSLTIRVPIDWRVMFEVLRSNE